MLGFLPRRSTKVLHGGGVLNGVFKTMDGSLEVKCFPTNFHWSWYTLNFRIQLAHLQIQVTQNHQGDGGSSPFWIKKIFAMKKYTPAMQNLNLGRHEKKLRHGFWRPVVFFIYPKEQPWVFRKSFPQEPSKPSRCKENEGNEQLHVLAYILFITAHIPSMTAYMLFMTAHTLFMMAYMLFMTANILFMTAYMLFMTPYTLFMTAYMLFMTAYILFITAN